MLAPYQLIRVFYKPGEAKGNCAAIGFKKDDIDLTPEPTKISPEVFKETGIETCCVVSKLASEHFAVQCFNKNNAIQYCGHGMMAAAKVIFDKYGTEQVVFNRNTSAVVVNHELAGESVELTMPRVAAQLKAVPGWVHKLLKLNDEFICPVFSAVSAEKDGYLLLEFPPVLSIDNFSALQLDVKKVCDNTRRAIVIIQFDLRNKHLYMRYFAPQYGVVEDSATGSVIRFVADYIDQRYSCRNYDVSQCSSQGGFMQVACEDEKVSITARVASEFKEPG